MKTQEISLDEIRRMLLIEPHITNFVAQDWSVPLVNQGIWLPRGREPAKKYMGKLASYLTAPYVEDDFLTHTDRRNWRLEMNTKYSWFHDFYSKNPLRNNRINVAIGSARLLRLDYGETNAKDLLQRLEDIAGFRTTPEYHTQLLEDKKEWVGGLKLSIYNLFKFLSEQEVAPKRRAA